MILDTWNARMAKAIAESKYKPNALATAVGASAPTVSAWIGAGSIAPAKDIKGDNLLRACELLNVRPEWVMFGWLPMRPQSMAWPFQEATLSEFQELPDREKARIGRFIRDTIDDWKSSAGLEERHAG